MPCMWRLIMQSRCWRRELLAPVLQRMLHRLQAAAFAAWKQQAVVEESVKEVADQAAHRHMAASLACMLQQWQVRCCT